MDYTRYLISAVRSDGLECSGFVECLPSEIKKINGSSWRPFTAKGAIVCTNPTHKQNHCYEHIGERFTFTNRQFKEEKL